MINNDFLCEGKTMERIYLDYAATTPVDKRVLDAMMPYMTTEFGNPSSLHAFGQKARAAVQTARDRVAATIGAEGREILFTAVSTLFISLQNICKHGIIGFTVSNMTGNAQGVTHGVYGCTSCRAESNPGI